MNTRKARKALPHRLEDVIACCRWHRFKRLHLASNLCTELAVIIERGSRDPPEQVMMVSLRHSILSKDIQALTEILQEINS